VSNYNLNLNVKIDVSDLAEAYAKVADVLERVKVLGDITKVDVSDKKPLHTGHVPGCRQVDSIGRVVRGETCTCGPVPR
jgi:hypothetical protein